MGRIALLVTAGVILLACTIAALTGVGNAGPGPVVALGLSVVVAVGGVVLRKRPGA